MGTVSTMQYLVSSRNRIPSIIIKYLILLSLAACALSAPQQVPYVHQEIPAEPYVHEEVPAEPYYGGEPTGYAGPAWTGGCVNNLGQGVFLLHNRRLRHSICCHSEKFVSTASSIGNPPGKA